MKTEDKDRLRGLIKDFKNKVVEEVKVTINNRDSLEIEAKVFDKVKQITESLHSLNKKGLEMQISKELKGITDNFQKLVSENQLDNKKSKEEIASNLEKEKQKTQKKLDDLQSKIDKIKVIKGEKGDSAITVSKTEPVNPKEGDLWYQP